LPASLPSFSANLSRSLLDGTLLGSGIRNFAPESIVIPDDPGFVRRSQRDGILTLTLCDPASRNSLSSRMMVELQRELDAVSSDAETRVIVLAADGPVFSSGHDMRELLMARHDGETGRARLQELMSQCSRLMQSIVNHPRPVLADVRGIATAAGCQLVASCDLAVASSASRFSTPGVNIGLFCSTPMVALSRNVRRKHAMEMLLTGEFISAAKACEIGLVNRVCSPDEMDDAVQGLAATIASKSMMTVSVGKSAFYRQVDLSLSEAYAFASQVMVENMLRHDAAEGIEAFLQKRPPEWRDE
jgi:enoyl-CoA hydratase/carnithine racemase